MKLLRGWGGGLYGLVGYKKGLSKRGLRCTWG